jgi:hypothetical protein
MARRVLIIDGYNVIGALSVLRGDRLGAGREALLDRLSRYALVRGHQVIAVFDGTAAVRHGAATHSHPGVKVVFSGPDEKADPVIVRMVRERRGECVVVSDDHGIRKPSDHAGAVILYCEQFDRLLACSEEEPVPAHPQASTMVRPAAAPPVAPLSAADREAWEAFASGVTRLPDEAPHVAAHLEVVMVPAAPPAPAESGRSPARPAVPDSSPPDPSDPWFVPDSVIAAKDADEERPVHCDRGPSRDERRRRHILDDL